MNSKLWPRITFVAALAFLMLGAKGCHNSYDDELRHELNGIGIGNQYSLPRPYSYTTAKGAIVKSVSPVPQSALDAIDRGLQRRIDRFHIIFPLWTAATGIRGTTIYFVHPNYIYDADGNATGPCELESIPGAPCVYVGGIKSAGTVAGTSDWWEHIDVNPPLIIPEQSKGDWRWLDYLAEAIHNEDEHRAGWLNRQNEPTGVFYHFLGANDQHPWQWGTEVPLTQEKRVITSEIGRCIPDDKEARRIVKEQFGIDLAE
jgi:hypothetical protein